LSELLRNGFVLFVCACVRANLLFLSIFWLPVPRE